MNHTLICLSDMNYAVTCMFALWIETNSICTCTLTAAIHIHFCVKLGQFFWLLMCSSPVKNTNIKRLHKNSIKTQTAYLLDKEWTQFIVRHVRDRAKVIGGREDVSMSKNKLPVSRGCSKLIFQPFHHLGVVTLTPRDHLRVDHDEVYTRWAHCPVEWVPEGGQNPAWLYLRELDLIPLLLCAMTLYLYIKQHRDYFT